MTDGVQMETSTAGGFMQGLKRAVTGESFFMSDFTFPADYTGSGQVTLGASHPCKIIPIDLSMFGGHLVCARGSYIAGSSKLQIEPFTAFKLSAGFFGGEGFVLQNIIGNDTVLVKGGGVVLTRDLQAGEILRVSTGCLLAFEGSVQYDIQRVGGFKNVLFGGEGLFVATLMGPGRVFIQALPFDHLAASIAQRIPRGGGGTIIPVGGGGMGGGGAGGVEAGGGGGGEGSAGDVGSGGGMPSDTGSAKDYESFEQKDDDDDDSGGGIGGGDDSDSGIGWLKKWF